MNIRFPAILVGVLALLPTVVRGQLGVEIARQYAERAGVHLAALHSLRSAGRIFIAGQMTQFTALAERPNRLRVETFTPARRVVQGYDGAAPPWISHTDTANGAPQDMGRADADDFIANADFDGPLVNFAAKGYSVDYAGEDVIDGRRARKLLLIGQQDRIFFLWVDAESFEIVKRLVYRVQQGRRVAVETRFGDFRPVAGVLQPCRIETYADGELLYGMIVDRMEGNGVVPPGAFVRP